MQLGPTPPPGQTLSPLAEVVSATDWQTARFVVVGVGNPGGTLPDAPDVPPDMPAVPAVPLPPPVALLPAAPPVPECPPADPPVPVVPAVPLPPLPPYPRSRPCRRRRPPCRRLRLPRRFRAPILQSRRPCRFRGRRSRSRRRWIPGRPPSRRLRPSRWHPLSRCCRLQRQLCHRWPLPSRTRRRRSRRRPVRRRGPPRASPGADHDHERQRTCAGSWASSQ